ncbi:MULTISPECIES: dihydrodipicolinate synthase family protein [unclassified Duganella]|uniref:dihydrodipicolinate synthase family protein n=1 Tax=unclassified Duganella TaxID=2636909 RepID=UPI0008923FE1|nr:MULTISPECIES: dihydrodipicolinate synthase family protein [unclassified Duganella]SDG35857.1 4-hydroxy-tetrahydrodipicolinate synthase [Duganella sp. OV458]SDJ67560.1 4-hydroxy-tetrahydrodipicolinate synthase [Duganella sp. OV510]
MFTGLSAFPITPLNETSVQEADYGGLVRRLAAAGVDSIGALGSTGVYAYLGREERARVTRLAVEHADGVPVMAGIGALRTRDVLLLAEDAQRAGASALLLAPMAYHALNADEVCGLFAAVSRAVSVPVCVYDNPGTTRFDFSDELHGRIAQLPHIASIKIPGVPADPLAAAERVARLRAMVPASVSIGVSGDKYASTGLSAGCEVWYSVIGGIFPQTALAITRAAQAGDATRAAALSARLQPLWELFGKYNGSLRVIAAAAGLMGLAQQPCLPLPLQAISGADREYLASLIDTLDLA